MMDNSQYSGVLDELLADLVHLRLRTIRVKRLDSALLINRELLEVLTVLLQTMINHQTVIDLRVSDLEKQVKQLQAVYLSGPIDGSDLL